MARSVFAVLFGIIFTIGFALLAGLIYFPPNIAMWLPFVGFILGCLIIGVVGRLRILHLLLLSFIIYLGLMVFLAANVSLLTGLAFEPLSFDRIQLAWSEFMVFVNTIPFMELLSLQAASLTLVFGDSILAVFLEFVVASMFVLIIGLLVTLIGGYLTRSSSVHVVSAPEPPDEVFGPEVPTTTPPMQEPAPAVPAAAPPPEYTAMEAPPPPMPEPQPVEDAPPLPSGANPAAAAIAGLKGKATKHLKGTGQKAPAGQSRCPHCNATVIRGSRFCNACEREI
ncbi:MAG: hypothetical protein ACFE8O_09590 [Candidatus Hermodarchaeota archaeon]